MHQHICKDCGETFKPRAKRALMVQDYTQEDIALVDLLYRQVWQNFPFLEATTKTTEKDFKEMNKIMRLDGRSYATIELVINWCQQDDFWKKNIRSVAKLRKQFDTLLVNVYGEHKNRQNKVIAV